ncbi:hypothetical protein FQN57_004359 [Myotisia sp. PD_48]|nr:hypothetical protein FQN57_004359 [Myotisia sp. PD_48]
MDGITTFAMTAIFTPPAPCSSSWTYEPFQINDVDNGLLLQNAGGYDGSDTSCFPPGLSNDGRRTLNQVFSPGYCPEGYSTVNVAVEQGTTTAVCCYPSYVHHTTLVRSWGVEFAGCTSEFPASSSTLVAAVGNQGRVTQVTGPMTMWALPITVQYESHDLGFFVSTTPGLPTRTVTQTTPTSIISTPESTDASTRRGVISAGPTPNEPQGLSTTAGIGIGVGVGVGGIAILASIGLLLLRRHKSKKNKRAPPYHHKKAQEVLPYSTRNMYTPSELDTAAFPAGPAELDGTDRSLVHELGAK